MTASLAESFGGLRLPVQASDVDRTLASLDPGRDVLLDLFAAAINAELTAAWAKVRLGLSPGHALGALPVSDTLPAMPTVQVMQERKAVFPLLALHRDGRGAYETHLIDQELLRQPWELHYILCPLDTADSRRLLDIGIAISKIVDRVVSRGGHPAYQSGAYALFGADTESALFGALRVIGHDGPGQAVFAGDEQGTKYWAMTVQLESVEYPSERTDENAGAFDGADYAIGIGGEPAGTIHGLMYASTDPPLQPQ
ncbi:MAG TPA: hypothetical protein VFR23_24725 [Jiangellaceae bacterium]|nr:hypothetical protein [Jiangellaceae bacterium]